MAQDPPCQCGNVARKLVTKKEGPNKGRWFWTCPTRQCRFFKWDDTTPRAVAAAGATTLPTDIRSLSRHSAGTAPPPSAASATSGTSTNINGTGTGTGLGAHLQQPLHIHFMIHSSGKIGIRVGFDHRVIEALRSIPDAIWDPVPRLWLFPASPDTYEKAVQILVSATARSEGSQIHPLPTQVIEVLKEQHNSSSSQTDNSAAHQQRLASVEQLDVWNVLKEFQKQGVREGIRRNGRMLLGDEMGLGKTIQALVLARAYVDAWPVLIVCPSSLRFTWKGEIKRWLRVHDEEICVLLKGGDMELIISAAAKNLGSSSSSNKAKLDSYMVTSNGSRKRRKVDALTTPQDIKFYIVSYDLATRDIDAIKKHNFQFIICDESHYIKSPQTKRTKALKPVIQKAKHALLLTGTPVFSRPIELFTQINALRPKLFRSRVAFGERYCDPQSTRFGVQYKGACNLSELNFVLENTILVRRLKNDVGLQLPPKTRQTVIVQPSQKDMKIIKELEKQADRAEQPQDHLKKQAILLELYTATCRAKIPIVQEYLDDVLESTNERIIIFAYHQEMMNKIGETLTKNKVEYIRIDGKTDPKVRQDLCEKFQSPSGNVKVALLSVAIGVGLTLSMADVVIFAELFWTPSQLLQAEDRAHRIGRTGPVTVRYILGLGTLDIMLWRLLKKKLVIIGEAIDGSTTKVNIDEATTTEYEAIDDDDSEGRELVNISEGACQELAANMIFE